MHMRSWPEMDVPMKTASFLVFVLCLPMTACVFEKGDGTYGGRRDNGGSSSSSSGGGGGSDCPSFSVESGTLCTDFPEGALCSNVNASGKQELCRCLRAGTASDRTWSCQ